MKVTGGAAGSPAKDDPEVAVSREQLSTQGHAKKKNKNINNPPRSPARAPPYAAPRAHRYILQPAGFSRRRRSGGLTSSSVKYPARNSVVPVPDFHNKGRATPLY